MLKILGEVNNMQLGIENDLRPIGQDLVSILKDTHDRALIQKDLRIKALIEENAQLKEKLKGGN